MEDLRAPEKSAVSKPKPKLKKIEITKDMAPDESDETDGGSEDDYVVDAQKPRTRNGKVC